jgi:UDP-glucose 4-epimerase
VGRRPQLTVYGTDFDTPDGTGVRDFVHVMVRGPIGPVEMSSQTGSGCLGQGRKDPWFLRSDLGSESWPEL